MTNYSEQADDLLKQAEIFDDTNPLKLCILTLACAAENYAIAETFEAEAEGTDNPIKRTLSAVAASVVKAAEDRLLVSVAEPIKAIMADRNSQNEELTRFIKSMQPRSGPN